MTRDRMSSVLAALTAILFLMTAALHHTGFQYVRDLAVQARGDLQTLVPPLWLFFSANLSILGLASAAAARRPSPAHRPLFLCLVLVPGSAAVLQLAYMGFIPPTMLLLADSALALATTLSLPGAAKPQPPRASVGPAG